MEPWTYERLFEALDRGAPPTDLDPVSGRRLAWSQALLRVLRELRPRQASPTTGSLPADHWAEPVEAQLVTAGPTGLAWRGASTPSLLRYELEVGALELGFIDDGALMGQVLDRAGDLALAGGSATLFGSSRVWFSDLDERSRFAFDAVLPGEYTLLLERAPHQVVVRGLALDDPNA